MTTTRERVRPRRSPTPSAARSGVTPSTSIAAGRAGAVRRGNGPHPLGRLPGDRRGRLPGGRRGRLLWVLAALLVVVAVALAATLGVGRWKRDHAASDAAAALAAGRQLAVNFVTMNATTYDADTARVLAGATGTFRTEYAATIAELKPVVTGNKTVSTVQRAEAALVTARGDTATVIVGVVAPTTNSAAATPQPKTYRLRLELARVAGEWKVSALDFVS